MFEIIPQFLWCLSFSFLNELLHIFWWALPISVFTLLRCERCFSNIIDLDNVHSAVNPVVSMSVSCALTSPSNLFTFCMPLCSPKSCSSLSLYWIKPFFFPGSLQGSKISKAIQNSSCLNASSNYTMNADRNCSKTSVIWRSHLKFVSPDRGLALGGRLKAYCCTWWTISSKYFFLNHLFLPALRFSNSELVRWT